MDTLKVFWSLFWSTFKRPFIRAIRVSGIMVVSYAISTALLIIPQINVQTTTARMAFGILIPILAFFDKMIRDYRANQTDEPLA